MIISPFAELMAYYEASRQGNAEQASVILTRLELYSYLISLPEPVEVEQ
jgi:hypothetical protein